MQPFRLVNVGNTNTTVVLWAAHGVQQRATMSTRAAAAGKAIPRLLAAAGAPIFGGTVVPAARPALDAAAAQTTHWLGVHDVTDVSLARIDASTIGIDRLANAVGAAVAGKLPALVLDFGTAISSVLVDADACLLGGFILPGRTLMRAALAGNTGLLPPTAAGAAPPAFIGSHTAAAIDAGVDQGALGAVARLIRGARAGVAGPLHVLAAGGDRDYYLENLAEPLTPAPPDLTFIGLARMAEKHRA